MTLCPPPRRNKVLNHFSIMQQRRLRDQDEEEEEKEKKAKKKGGELKIHDLEDDLELSSEDSEASEAEGEPWGGDFGDLGGGFLGADPPQIPLPRGEGAEAEEEGAGGEEEEEEEGLR